jgi:23S rRNA (adenine2503-C2)-methyltransferase
MKIIASAGREDVAMVYLADLGAGRLVEFVESVQPPLSREQKWVLIVSTLLGCPVGCQFCDAGGDYKGRLSKDEIFAQIDFLVKRRFPDGVVPIPKFKIQFARMGEPAFNSHVLDVLEEFPQRYDAPGFLPSISTIAPCSTESFFERLLEIKREKYQRFQFQYSIHTTDERLRDWLIPVKKWTFAQMAEYGERFHTPGGSKITLNFALAKGMPVDPRVLSGYFPSDKYLIKMTPVNPTYRARQNGLTSYITGSQDEKASVIAEELRSFGYSVIVSIGESEENQIGSNCGQYVRRHLQADGSLPSSYDYWRPQQR